MAKPKKTPLAPLATRVKSDPALLERALANPGLRAKLPDRFLTPQQRAARQRNAFLRDFGDIGTPLSGQSMVNAAQQITNSEFAPLLSNIGQQEQIVNKSAGIQGDWAKRYYGDLNSLLGGAVGGQTAANTAAVQAAQGRAAATQGAIAGADQAAQQRLTQDAAVRGADVQGSAAADLAARTAASQGVAATEGQRNVQAASDAGGVQAAFLRGLQGATAQQGGEYQQQITGAQNQALNALAQQRREIDAKRPGALADLLLKLRDSEAQNAITQASLLTNAQKAQLSADSDAASLAERIRHNRAQEANDANDPSKQKTQAEIDYFNKHGYWPPTGPPKAGRGGSGGSDRATNAAIGAAQDGSSTALADAKKLFSTGIHDRGKLAQYLLQGSKGTTQAVYDDKGKPKFVKDAQGNIVKATVTSGSVDKHDPLYTSVALDVLLDGHVSRYNAQRLHARGLKVSDLGAEFPSLTAYSKKRGKTSMLTNGPGR